MAGPGQQGHSLCSGGCSSPLVPAGPEAVHVCSRGFGQAPALCSCSRLALRRALHNWLQKLPACHRCQHFSRALQTPCPCSTGGMACTAAAGRLPAQAWQGGCTSGMQASKGRAAAPAGSHAVSGPPDSVPLRRLQRQRALIRRQRPHVAADVVLCLLLRGRCGPAAQAPSPHNRLDPGTGCASLRAAAHPGQGPQGCSQGLRAGRRQHKARGAEGCRPGVPARQQEPEQGC